MTAQLVPITGEIRDYAWGTRGGISRALGRAHTDVTEAELWLGAHPSAPSRRATDGAGWTDLAAWERAGNGHVPFLMKVLSAAAPLSLQAHPTPKQAAEGFARENAAGIPCDARERNYKDPQAKPELIVALEDGFEALCGFRPLPEASGVAHDLADLAGDAAPFAEWTRRLDGDDGVRAAFEWLLSGEDDVRRLVSAVTAVTVRHPGEYELVARLAAEYPGDPGIVIALMLNHVTLSAGEALWLPAGNIHAYLRGIGMELMGPSDNVLRGGLTPKHVDTEELRRVLDFGDGEPPLLGPVALGPELVSYRPRSLPSGADVQFKLLSITGDAAFATGSPAIGIVLNGSFRVDLADAHLTLQRGQSVFVTDAAFLRARGTGRFFVATA